MLSDPVPLMVRLVTPMVAVSPLNEPAKLIGLFTLIARALIPAAPAGKPAALAELQTDGVAVSAVVVDHCGVVVSQVPLVGADSPLLSQYQTAALAL